MADWGLIQFICGEDIVILEFSSYEEATSWYHSPAYRTACERRFQGGDCRCIVTEGVEAK